jgi:hypothetical protein
MYKFKSYFYKANSKELWDLLAQDVNSFCIQFDATVVSVNIISEGEILITYHLK